MPDFNILRETTPSNSYRVASVIGRFDLPSACVREEFKGSLDTPPCWQIGLIMGRSGTGKSTIAKELFPDSYICNFDYSSKAVIDDMPISASVEAICNLFTSVGFSTPLSWLKPYSVLSNGEKMRVDIARAILEDRELVVFDEFTSVVDREVAKTTSFCLQKAIRKHPGKQFIAVTCHSDVANWLLPDWILDTDSMTFSQSNKKKDQTSISRYSKQMINQSGRFLANITI